MRPPRATGPTASGAFRDYAEVIPYNRRRRHRRARKDVDEVGSDDRETPGWPPLSAAVLAGGLSTRMGTDKALLPLVAGGPPMLAIVLERLRAVADDVTIVSESRPGYDGFGAPVVPDDFPGTAALGGIATALRHARHDHCLVVACDMPLLWPPLLRWLAAEPRDFDVLVPRLPGESRQGGGTVFQTLHAIYGRACLRPIEAQLAGGDRQVIGFFPRVRTRAVDEREIRRHDPDLRSFFNANTPDAAAQAAALLGAEAGREAADGLGEPRDRPILPRR